MDEGESPAWLPDDDDDKLLGVVLVEEASGNTRVRVLAFVNSFMPDFWFFMRVYMTNVQF